MKSFFALLYVLLAFAGGAQDCSKLVTYDTMSVCREQYYDLLIQGKYDEWYKAEHADERLVAIGYKVEIAENDADGNKIEHTLYPVKEPARVYLKLDSRYPYFACQLVRYKHRYELLFADDTRYNYDQPFAATCDDHFYILLSGKSRELHWDADRSKVEQVTPFNGDTVLLKKMQHVPIQKVIQYSAFKNGAYMQKKEGRVYEDYEIAQELRLPQAEAIKLMQSLQCLAKEK